MYSDNDLKKHCTQAEDIFSKDCLLVLVSNTDFDCNVNITEVYAFKNKYDAINYFFDYINEWKTDFNDIEYKKLSESINILLSNVSNNKTDIGIDLEDLSFCTDSLSLCILEYGYWSKDTISRIISYFIERFDNEIELLRDDTTAGHTIQLLNEKIENCEALVVSYNTTDNYINDFTTICSFFSDYFDPFKEN